ncbi:cation:dicarboxylate symporter family transporter [Bifidobacterium coryneforme]|uniref:cation:dicarboxylate symporter family transporter n=1 Tax=Bifidobacterium coryneforme TaxID=1687 RepID=UPI000AC49A9F|nr:cation:dicarboxylase symporter family transporter [Bifidobacterium coryneforme]
MSETSWDWAALIVVVVLFAGLALLSKKTKVNFSWRVIIATVLGIIVGVGFSGHTAYVGAFGAIWSKVISAIVVPLLLFSIVASIGRIGGAGRLKNISLKTIVPEDHRAPAGQYLHGSRDCSGPRTALPGGQGV